MDPGVKRAFDRLTESLIHPRGGDGDGQVAFGAETIGTLLVIAFAGNLLLTAYHLAAGDLGPAWVPLVVAASLALAPLFTRVIGTPGAIRGYVLATVWLYVTLTVATSGGATSRALYLYALVPIFASGFAAPRHAALWTVASLTSLGAFYVLRTVGVSFPADGIYALHLDVPTAAIATIAVYASTVRLVASRRAARRAMASAAVAVAAANARAEEARAQLERARDANRLVLTRVGHRFHFPLETIVDASRELERRLPSALREHAQMVERSAARLLARVDAFAAYTSVWRAAPAGVSFDPIALATAVVAEHRARADAKALTFGLDLIGALPARCVGDTERVAATLRTLVGDAIEATVAGRVIVAVRVLDGDLIAFDVHDTRSLADPERAAHRSAASASRPTDLGSGLARAVAHRLATAMGGTVTVSDDQRRVILVLPHALAAVAASAPAAPAEVTC